MLKKLFGLLCITIIGVACLKSGQTGCAYSDNNVSAPQAQRDSIKAYLDSNDLVATEHPSGFFYRIVTPGSGQDSLRLCSQIAINYTGKFVNDTVFDKAPEAFLVLGSLIEGWKKGLPLIKKGGEIKLYIPPALGYGDSDVRDRNTGAVVIPGKSILIFDVKLLDHN